MTSPIPPNRSSEKSGTNSPKSAQEASFCKKVLKIAIEIFRRNTSQTATSKKNIPNPENLTHSSSDFKYARVTSLFKNAAHKSESEAEKLEAATKKALDEAKKKYKQGKKATLDLSNINLSTKAGKTFLQALSTDKLFHNLEILLLHFTNLKSDQLEALKNCKNLINLDLSGNPGLVVLNEQKEDLSKVIPQQLLNQLTEINLKDSISINVKKDVDLTLTVTSTSLKSLALEDVKIKTVNLESCPKLQRIEIEPKYLPTFPKEGIKFIKVQSGKTPFLINPKSISTPLDQIFISPEKRINYESKTAQEIINDLNYLESLRDTLFIIPNDFQNRNIPFYQNSMDKRMDKRMNKPNERLNPISTEERIIILKKLALQKTKELIESLNPSKQKFDTQEIYEGPKMQDKGILLTTLKGITMHTQDDDTEEQSFELEVPENTKLEDLKTVVSAVLSLCTNIKKIQLKGSALNTLEAQKSIVELINEKKRGNPIEKILLPKPSTQEEETTAEQTYKTAWGITKVNKYDRHPVLWISESR